MANKVTIYGAHHGTSTNIRTLCGDLQQVSMWNTITNVLRMMVLIIKCYRCSDGRYYKTADGKLYKVKTQRYG